MTERAALAAILRATQWELDTAAFEIGGGRYPSERRRALADNLEGLARVLREPREGPCPRAAPGHGRPLP